jgi:hypothetical protein
MKVLAVARKANSPKFDFDSPSKERTRIGTMVVIKLALKTLSKLLGNDSPNK